MIYKDFVAEAAQKIMAEGMKKHDFTSDNELQKELAENSVNAAKALADALDQDWQEQTVVDGVHRYSEGEPFFDNYVNWTKTK